MDFRRISIVFAVLVAVSAVTSPLEQLLVRLVIGKHSAPAVSMIAPTPSLDGSHGFLLDESRFSVLAAPVVGEPPDHLLQRLLLAAGSDEQVAVGDAVSTPDGIYLGRIVATRRTTSTMAYLGSELHRVTVRIGSKDRPLGILQGRGISGARVDYLEKNVSVPLESPIVVSERDERVPAGLFVGRVAHVSADATGVFQQAEVRLAVPFSAIEKVVIITTRVDK